MFQKCGGCASQSHLYAFHVAYYFNSTFPPRFYSKILPSIAIVFHQAHKICSNILANVAILTHQDIIVLQLIQIFQIVANRWPKHCFTHCTFTRRFLNRNLIIFPFFSTHVRILKTRSSIFSACNFNSSRYQYFCS